MNELIEKKNTTPTAKVIYILLIVGTIVGFTGIIGLIMAYVFKDDSTDWLQTHYRFQIRTYWIGLLYVALGIFTLTYWYRLLYFIIYFCLDYCALCKRLKTTGK